MSFIGKINCILPGKPSQTDVRESNRTEALTTVKTTCVLDDLSEMDDNTFSNTPGRYIDRYLEVNGWGRGDFRFAKPISGDC